ncbi:MAG: ABC transporter ATP-binding protein [Bacilli bacterium]
MENYINLVDVSKEYGQRIKTIANNNINFSLKKGSLCVIIGASGAGKTTLLNILGGMDSPTSGKVIIDDIDIASLTDNELTKYRRYDCGFIFQFYNLISSLTAKENIELASEISKSNIDVNKLLQDVGLFDKKDNFPSQLSGGEQQRVAIARALAKTPKLLLCDEPTGALDYDTGKNILKLLQETKVKYNMTIIIVTHNQAIAPIADVVIKMKDAKIHEYLVNDRPLPVDLIEW